MFLSPFGTPLKVKRECSSGIERPYSAENLRQFSHSARSSGNGNIKVLSVNLTGRPHTSCDQHHNSNAVDAPNQVKPESSDASPSRLSGDYGSPSRISSDPGSRSTDLGSPSRIIGEAGSRNNSPLPKIRTFKRRYFLSSTSGPNDPKHDEDAAAGIPTMSHFDVRVQTDETKVDHLRLYYCDFLSPRSCPSPLPQGDEKTVEVERMSEWILTIEPRTRLDAYPLWVLTRDLFRRFLSKDLRLVSGQAALIADQLAAAQAAARQAADEVRARDEALAAVQDREREGAALARELEEARAAAADLAAAGEALRAQADRLAQERDAERAAAARRTEEHALEAKARANAAWQGRLDKALEEAERARVDADTDRALLEDVRGQLDECRRELDSARAQLAARAPGGSGRGWPPGAAGAAGIGGGRGLGAQVHCMCTCTCT